ncbi:hypothetical protein KBD08_03605 [Candidatus Babeliales bacterium]|nr:hypothetical protein [Candidatus Babeliales bacterium]
MKNIRILALLGLLSGCLSVNASQSKFDWNMLKPVLGAGYVAGSYAWMNNVKKDISVASTGDIAPATSVIPVIDISQTIPVAEPSSVRNVEDGSFASKALVGLMCSVSIGFIGTSIATIMVQNRLVQIIGPF